MRSNVTRAQVTSLILACTTVFLSSNQAFGQNNVSSKDSRSSWLARSKRLAQKLLIVPISPPQSGVRLIEEVFQRVRSSPEIAIQLGEARKRTLVSMMKQNDNMIRPKQQGQVVLQPSPSLQLLPPPPHQPLLASAGGGGAFSAGAAGGGVRQPKGKTPSAFDALTSDQSETAAAKAPVFAEQSAAADNNKPAAAPPVIDAWMGAKHFPDEEPSQAQQPGVWNREVAVSSDAGMQNAHYERSARLEPDRSTYQIASATAAKKAFPSSQANAFPPAGESAALRSRTATRPPNLATSIMKMVTLGNAIDRVTSGELPPGNAVGLTGANSFKDKETIAYSGQPPASLAAAPPAAPSSQAQSSHAAMAKTAKKSAAYSAASRAEKARSADFESVPLRRRGDRTIAMSDSNIAVLPPNVFTGIPLVRLGIPESQANSALNSFGTTRQEKVANWTVMSWRKKSGTNQTALQLYVRNGLLDAMRIFDPSLIGPEFGVNIGDGLVQMKEKFGDPAFILNEPGPGAGKNYIYPVSQVGFQLVPPQPGEEPRVASVLIFNVK